jgi:hypothetical protein
MINPLPKAQLPLVHSNSRIRPQGELAGAVAGILCGLRGTRDAEGWVIDLRGGRSEVGVVEYVGKCGLKAHSYSLGERGQRERTW